MEMKEFVSGNKTEDKKKTNPIKKKVNKAKKSYSRKAAQLDLRELKENKSLIMFCILIILVVLSIVIGMLVFKLPIVTAGVVIIIEALLAACLHDLPVWVHGIVVIAEIILGFAVAKTVFMILVSLCYLAALFALKFQKEMA